MQVNIYMAENESYKVGVEPYDPLFAQLMLSAPQVRVRGTEWELAVTEPNTQFLATKITARFGKDVTISPAARIFLTKALVESKLLSVRAKRRAEYTFKDECPQITDYYFKEEYPPYKHQIVGFDAVRHEDCFALLMEMGTGKTPVSIHDICYAAIKKVGGRDIARSGLPAYDENMDDATKAAVKLERASKIYKVLVLAPKSVCSNWGKEMKKHSTLPYAFGVLRGATTDRVKTISAVLQSKPRLKIVACNWEACTKDEFVKILQMCMFDTVIGDESTRIKTMGAARTKGAIKLVMPFRDHQPRRRILSGQPITKNVLDLYSQFEFLRPGDNPLGYTSFAAYAKRFSVQDPFTKKVVPANVDELKSAVGNFSFIVKKHECLDLPAKVYQQERVEMSEEQAKFYDDIEADIVKELMSDEGDKKFRVSATNTLVLLLRLAQVTSGFVPADKGEEDPGAYRERHEFKPNPKLDRLVEIVEELVDLNGEGQKVLIWACFKADIKAIEQALMEQGIASVTFFGETKDKERELALTQFEQNDQIRVFIGQPQSGGIGLTLTGSEKCPTGTALYYSRNFSLEQRTQSEDRAHRIGMFRPLTIIDLLSVYPEGYRMGADETIDTRILRRLTEKKDLAEGFTDAKSIAMSMLGMVAPAAPAQA